MNLGPPLATAARIAFVVASAPAIGSALLVAIGRLTGARWEAALLPPAALRLTIVGAAAVGAAQLAHPAPPHLALWMHPLFVGARAILATGALAVAAARLRDGAGPTFAAVALALYAALVTPVASDWLLGQEVSHPVSSIGMMLFVAQIAAAAALVLVGGAGAVRFRRDLGRLMIAALLGLGYLGFMDYLIVWFGNLPSHVGFYAVRDGAGAAALVWAALVLGLAVPIVALPLGRERVAGLAALAALLLFVLWWVGGDLAGSVVGAALAMGLLGLTARTRRTVDD